MLYKTSQLLVWTTVTLILANTAARGVIGENSSRSLTTSIPLPTQAARLTSSENTHKHYVISTSQVFVSRDESQALPVTQVGQGTRLHRRLVLIHHHHHHNQDQTEEMKEERRKRWDNEESKLGLGIGLGVGLTALFVLALAWFLWVALVFTNPNDDDYGCRSIMRTFFCRN